MRGVRELRLRPGLVDPVGRTALKAGEGRICGGSFDASAQRRPIAVCPGQARALQSLLVAFIAQYKQCRRRICAKHLQHSVLYLLSVAKGSK
ncbi:hypothetical protein PVAP13_5KG245107 [Panicum virgatum]|uniref:Uncharacterized protein n=1 Tax=Panicum virgatum TaxID=38727 RepID=A0A8T0SHH7_PANVG|nr:hypothetical protein PVAP13_5KG245107 [Panicum virgatum]